MKWVRSRFLPHVLGNWIMLFNEFLDRHEASSHSDHQIVSFQIHEHLVLEEAVVTFRLSDKEGLHALVWATLVDEFGEFAVNFIIFVRHVLEVDLVELIPVLNHLFELLITSLEMLHHLIVFFHLGLVFLKSSLHGFKTLHLPLNLVSKVADLSFIGLVESFQ